MLDLVCGVRNGCVFHSVRLSYERGGALGYNAHTKFHLMKYVVHLPRNWILKAISCLLSLTA